MTLINKINYNSESLIIKLVNKEVVLKIKKNKIALEIYGVIGKSLCACSGGIVGFVMGGPAFAIIGVVMGTVVGHLLEKVALNGIY